MTRCFVDTNVLVYTKDQAAPSKQAAAKAWLSLLSVRNVAVLSAQGLREFYAVARRRFPAIAEGALRSDVHRLLPLLRPETLVDYLDEAWRIQDRFRLSFWDALMMASAQAAGCTHYLSEDLQHGQDLGGVRVVDPFRAAPTSLFA